MKKILGAVSLLVLCGMLIAGLWPFNFFPRNDVAWLKNSNGLQFGDRARVYSSRNLEVPDSKEDSFCSLELWLQPDGGSPKRPATILLFTAPDNPLQFRVRQSLDILLLRQDARDQQNHLQTLSADVEYSLRQDQPTFFTITTGPKDILAYKDGASVKKVFPGFGLSCKDFSGELILGGTLTSPRSWPGKLLGLAIYGQELTPEQVSQHFAMWTHNAPPEGFANDHPLAFYSFSERAGSVVHNRVASSPDLYIPRIFRVPRKKMLTPPWEEFSPDLSYASDLLINIAGFAPFGFFHFGYLTWNRRWDRAALSTVILGGLLSLTIEILQEYLITRRSGMTDIITNTLGTGVGVMMWTWQPVQSLVARFKKETGQGVAS
jgi:VanZ family protein